MRKVLAFGSIMLTVIILLLKINSIKKKHKINDDLQASFSYTGNSMFSDTVFYSIPGFPNRIKLAISKKKDGLFDSIAVKAITPVKYQMISPFAGENLLRFEQGSRYGYLDTLGNEVIPAIYTFALDFVEGVAAVEVNSKWGYINTKNEFVLPPTYESAMDFYKGKAVVKLGGKWGFINRSGKFVIPPLYDDVICTFSNSDTLAKVLVGNSFSFIDNDGKFLGNSIQGY